MCRKVKDTATPRKNHEEEEGRETRRSTEGFHAPLPGCRAASRMRTRAETPGAHNKKQTSSTTRPMPRRHVIMHQARRPAPPRQEGAASHPQTHPHPHAPSPQASAAASKRGVPSAAPPRQANAYAAAKASRWKGDRLALDFNACDRWRRVLMCGSGP